MSDIVSDNTRV